MKNIIRSERVNLFEPNAYIQFLVRITGKPNIEELMEAVKSAFRANEATMCKVVLEADGTAFYKKMSVSGCRVSVTDKDWLTVSHENERLPFQIGEGELVRVFICTSDEEIRLLIMAHHLVGDGKSVTYLLEDIMRALSGEKLVYKELCLLTDESFPKKAKLPRYFKWYANGFNRKWKRSGCVFSWEDYKKIHESYWKDRSSQIVYESFSKEKVETLKQRARSIGVSVNSYIATAFLRADTNNHCIGMAVDARDNHNRSVSNQATGISADYTYSEKISFAENARSLHQKIHQKLDRPVMRYFILQFMALFEPTLIDSILLYTHQLYENKTAQKLAKVLGYKGGNTRELGITNLTRLDIPDEYGRYAIRDVLFIPPVVSYAKHIIGVVTMEDGMRISYHYMSSEDDAAERSFFERAIGYIREEKDF